MKKTRMLRLFVCLAVSSTLSFGTKAQVFNPPTSYEDSYPSSGVNISRTTHTSCYANSSVNILGSSEDLVVSAWDEVSLGGTVAWRRLVPGSPSTVISQGMITYPAGYRDLEVAFMYVGSTIKIFVAYYKSGSGHYCEVYDLLGGGPVLSTIIPLSGSPNYGRISIDCHRMYGMVVTWEENAVIKTRVAWDNSGTLGVSPIVTFSAPIKRYLPDVAFSHAGSGLLCQYVYHEIGSVSQIAQSSFDFWTMAGFGGPTTVVPTLQDINVLGSGNVLPSPPNIDCPDHYNVDNWAYTYHLNTNNDIYVRLVDFNSTGVPNTIVVNDGSFGNFPINSAQNINPFLAYDINNDNFHVGWFTNYIDPATVEIASYISVDVHESGTAILSTFDYLTVPNTPIFASGTPFLSFSKHTESTDYLYTIFPQYNLSTGYEMQHKYHQWGSLGAFKGEHATHYTCNDDGRLSYLAEHANGLSSSVYPNPFKNQLHISLSPEMLSEVIDVTITNITGTVVYSTTGTPDEINENLNDVSNITTGMYIMNISCEATGYNNVVKLQKID